MSKRSARKELRVTAYHEAGHAVAAFMLRRGISYVTIEADKDSLGSCKHPRGIREFSTLDVAAIVDLRLRAKVEREIMILFAGDIAERQFRHRRRQVRGSWADYGYAVDLADYVTTGDNELELYLDWLYGRTENLITRIDVWPAIEALATALLEDKRIGQRRARRIIQAARKAAMQKILDEHDGGVAGASPPAS